MRDASCTDTSMQYQHWKSAKLCQSLILGYDDGCGICMLLRQPVDQNDEFLYLIIVSYCEYWRLRIATNFTRFTHVTSNVGERITMGDSEERIICVSVNIRLGRRAARHLTYLMQQCSF